MLNIVSANSTILKITELSVSLNIVTLRYTILYHIQQDFIVGIMKVYQKINQTISSKVLHRRDYMHLESNVKLF